MEEKKINPIRPGMTSNSSPLPSMYGNDFLELVWKNGQIVVQGGSSSTSSRTRKRPSCIGYSLNPCLEGYDEDPCITKRARPSTLYSLLDSSHQNSQPSYLVDFNYTKSNSFSNKLEHEFSNSRAGSKETNSKTTVGNTQLCSSSSHSHSHKHEDSGSDQRIGKLNFSNFLKPALFLKSGFLGNNATPLRNGDVSARVEELKAGTHKYNAADANSKAADHSLVIDSANKGSHSLNGIQHHEDQPALTSQKANQTVPINVTKSDEKTLLPDQHSKTQGSHAQCHHQTHKAKGKFAAQFYNEPMVASSSLCSLGASNNPTLRSRKHEDTDDSNYTSDNDEEEDVIKKTPSREDSRGKRSRNAAIHNLSERKRRDKINKKMRALKELIPNCNKMDKASMLDDAIDYLKTLKLQLQVMSMGSSLCMPLMMVGGGGHHLAQLMGGGMSLRPSGIGVPYSLPPPQFPLHAHAHSITDNPLHMLGFPNHMLPVPFSMSPPFIPMPPKHLPPNLSTPHSTTTSTLHASLPNYSNLVCAQSAGNKENVVIKQSDQLR